MGRETQEHCAWQHGHVGWTEKRTCAELAPPPDALSRSIRRGNVRAAAEFLVTHVAKLPTVCAVYLEVDAEVAHVWIDVWDDEVAFQVGIALAATEKDHDAVPYVRVRWPGEARTAAMVNAEPIYERGADGADKG